MGRARCPMTINDYAAARDSHRRDDRGDQSGKPARDLPALRPARLPARRSSLTKPVLGRTAEVGLLVLLDVERGQELGVEVARREAETRPVVVVDDPDDVGGAHLIDGARDTVLSMVVRRDGERPGA